MLNLGFHNMDCMIAMKEFPDKYFDLAIVDPPYGQTWGNLFDITSGDTEKLKSFFGEARRWDNKPSQEYFNELDRCSKRYIIWGYNYFTEFLGNTNDLLIWDKQITGNKFFLRFEIAYCSFNVSGIFKAMKGNGEKKEHPTQKPITLYKWLLQNYAKPGDIILDTHVGSASSLIACEQMGFKYFGTEIDCKYYQAAVDRMRLVLSQTDMFMEKQ